MNILLVESDRILGQTYKTALESAGYNVVWRRSGQIALDALDEQLPDVIVLEIQLGIHGGIEFLYELRSQTDWQNLPVIIHTLNPHAGEREFRRAFAHLGVETILYKPDTTMPTLLKVIERSVRQTI